MDRLQNTDLSATPPAATTGTTGYPRISVPGGVTASAMHPYYLYMLIEELRAVIVAGGGTPAFTTLDQVQTAIAAQITAATPAASETVSGIVELATSAETITGSSSALAVHPSGLAAALAVGPGNQTFVSASGTYAVPTGVTSLLLELGAGGGGGGGADTGASEDGFEGHAGQQLKYVVTVTPGETLTITIGAAGSGGAVNTNGTAGGNTSIAGTFGTKTATAGTGGISIFGTPSSSEESDGDDSLFWGTKGGLAGNAVGYSSSGGGGDFSGTQTGGNGAPGYAIITII